MNNHYSQVPANGEVEASRLQDKDKIEDVNDGSDNEDSSDKDRSGVVVKLETSDDHNDSTVKGGKNITLMRCHICHYLTFRDRNLSAHLFTVHGLPPPSDSFQKSLEYVEICEYAASAFRDADGNVQPPLSKDVKEESANGDDLENTWWADYDDEYYNSDENYDDENYDEYGYSLYGEDYEDDDYGQEYKSEPAKKRKRASRTKVKQNPENTVLYRLPELEDMKIEMDESQTKYRCPKCDFVGKKEANVRLHYGRMHIVKSEMYNCPHCDYSTRKRQDMHIHVKAIHEQKRDFQCEYCPYSTTRNYRLKKHISTKHFGPDGLRIEDAEEIPEPKKKKKREGPAVKQDVIGSLLKIFPKSFQKVNDQDNFICEVCNFTTTGKGNLIRHMKRLHLDPAITKCKYCDFVVSNQKERLQHMLKAHPEEGRHLMCNHCDFRTHYNKNLKDHIKKVHMKALDFQCGYCDYMCGDKLSLECHMHSTHSDKLSMLPKQVQLVTSIDNKNYMYTCSSCPFSTNFLRAYVTHVKDAHNLPIEFARCSICEFSASSKAEMKEHLHTVHADLKHLRCQACDYMAPTVEDIAIHEKKTCGGLQNGEDGTHFHYVFSDFPVRVIYQCDSCDFNQRKRERVVNHKRSVHEKIKLHMCDLCSYTASKYNNLSRHIKAKHSDIKDFTCNLCDFATSNKWNLNDHMKKHQREEINISKYDINDPFGEKKVPLAYEDYRHQCKYCLVKFAWPKRLQRHLKTHNPEYETVHPDFVEKIKRRKPRKEVTPATAAPPAIPAVQSEPPLHHNPLPPPPPHPMAAATHSVFQLPSFQLNYMNQFAAQQGMAAVHHHHHMGNEESQESM